MLAGIVVTVLSSVLYNSGFVLEKLALRRMPDIHARDSIAMVRALVSSPLWVAGFCLLLIGLGCQVLALSLVPISVVQPVFVSGIVVLLFLSHVFLGEQLGPSEWRGICLITVALVLIGLSLDPHSDKASLSGHVSDVVVAAIPTVIVGLLAFAIADRMDTSGRHDSFRALLFGVASGLLYGIAALGTKGVSTSVGRDGLVASVPHVLASGYIYLLVGFAIAGLLLFQTGLQRCRASIVVPVSNVVSSAYLVAAGTVVFGEHLPASPWRFALRIGGFVCVVIGMLALARGHALDASPAEAGEALPA